MVLHRSTNNGHSRFSVEWRDLAQAVSKVGTNFRFQDSTAQNAL
jgi:hypothetical protein